MLLPNRCSLRFLTSACDGLTPPTSDRKISLNGEHSNIVKKTSKAITKGIIRCVLELVPLSEPSRLRIMLLSSVQSAQRTEIHTSAAELCC